MADGAFGVSEASVPDVYFDTGLHDTDSGIVHRARVEDPELIMLLRSIRSGLAALASCISNVPNASTYSYPVGQPAAVTAAGAGSRQLRVTGMSAAPRSLTPSTALSSVLTVKVVAMERWDFMAQAGVVSVAQTPALGLLDPLAQYLTAQGVVVV